MPPRLAIRPSTAADVRDIEALLLGAYDARLRPYLTYAQPGIGRYLEVVLARPNFYPSHALLSAVDDGGRVRGFAEFRSLDAHAMLLSWFAVHEEFRGQGLGTRMLRHAATNYPVARVLVDVFESNVGARRLYDRLGFEAIADSSWLVRATNRGATAGDALDVQGWHEARAGLEAYGFCRVQASWLGSDVQVGLLGSSTVRINAPGLFQDDAFLEAVRVAFPERETALHVSAGEEVAHPGTEVLLRSTRLETPSGRLS